MEPGFHKSKALVIPNNIEIIYMPPYSPELNPVERLWRHMKDIILKNRIYETLNELEEVVCSFIRGFDPNLIKKHALLIIPYIKFGKWYTRNMFN